MDSDERVDMLLNRRKKEIKADYIYYKKLVKQKQENAKPTVKVKVKVNKPKVNKRKSVWEGWKTYSRTTSNIRGKNHSFVTYHRELYGKTTYVAVHYINGIEKSRSTTTY